MEDKLLFVLVYTKPYPLQVVHGKLFGMSQSSANEWLQFLLPVLAAALARLGMLPEREGQRVAQRERRKGEPRDLIVDGGERRRHRPKSKQTQALPYSGKKKGHYPKNLVVVNTTSTRVRRCIHGSGARAREKGLPNVFGICGLRRVGRPEASLTSLS